MPKKPNKTNPALAAGAPAPHLGKVNPKIGEILRAANLIDEEQLNKALAIQRQSGSRLGSALVELKFIDENVLSAFLGMQKKIPGVSLQNRDIDAAAIALLPGVLAFKHGALPVAITGNCLTVAMTDPFDEAAIADIARETGKKILPAIAPQSSLYAALKRYYPDPSGLMTTVTSAPAPNSLLAKLKEIQKLLSEIERELTR